MARRYTANEEDVLFFYRPQNAPLQVTVKENVDCAIDDQTACATMVPVQFGRGGPCVEIPMALLQLAKRD